MFPRKLIICGCAFVAFLLNTEAQDNASGTNKPVLYYVPHTHWEGAVFKTREGYLEMGLQNILRAMRLLKAYPDYKFTLDQVAYFKPFWNVTPKKKLTSAALSPREDWKSLAVWMSCPMT